jgi:septal ring factor EnvC (AmiA/AmiB activator)
MTLFLGFRFLSFFSLRKGISRAVLLLTSVVVLLLVAAPSQAPAQSRAEVADRSLEQKQAQMRTYERLLRELSQQERGLFGDLQQVEGRIKKAEGEVASLKKELEQLRKAEQNILEEYRRLDLARTQTSAELRKLLVVLWPVHLRGLEQNVQGLGSWAEADRQFSWLSRVYALVREQMATLQVQGQELALAQVRAKAARAGIVTQLELVNTAKDALLTQKLDFLQRVHEVRAQRISAEEQLKDILQTITELNYQLKRLGTKKFTAFKGRMPWPGQGKVVGDFHPRSKPPHRGLSLAMSEQAPVHAVSWGKVVHSNVLRGYGHVVIIYHGEDYYSLYAFLNDVSVRVGQEVEKNERLGSAGFYPKVNGPGLYFELRFRQNPVNPKHWLAAK